MDERIEQVIGTCPMLKARTESVAWKAASENLDGHAQDLLLVDPHVSAVFVWKADSGPNQIGRQLKQNMA